MHYRIEISHNTYSYRGENEIVNNKKEVKRYIKECIPSGYRAIKIVKVLKDGSGHDVTSQFKL